MFQQAQTVQHNAGDELNGNRPRVLIATTPRTTPFMKKLVAMDDVRITSGSTYSAERDHPLFQKVRLSEMVLIDALAA